MFCEAPITGGILGETLGVMEILGITQKDDIHIKCCKKAGLNCCQNHQTSIEKSRDEKGSLDSPLDMIQSKFNDIFLTLK
ncbi:unnamed protein product [Moneuplotes crassus]|uniref:Uncharacterized protein n=1 Tax=Euplotes crassus TaxID=5936 RepID=A0AAD1XEE1_EUPCR|nr:unnamed protein product [Moneuplotes crassus]